MANQIDEILVEQWQSAKHRKKMMQKYKLFFPTEPVLIASLEMVDKQIAYLEMLVSDKKLLVPDKRKKTKNISELLNLNPWTEWARMTVIIYEFGSHMFMRGIRSYLSILRQDKK